MELVHLFRVFGFPYRASRDITEKFSIMGTPSLQTFLKSYWLTPVKLTGQLSRSMQIITSSRQYKCRAHDNYIRIFSFTTDSCNRMTSYCRICTGPIENPPDSHDHCITCLGLAHAKVALEESNCTYCADLPMCVLRTHRNVARGLFGVGPPPPPEGGVEELAWSHRSQRSPRSSVTWAESEQVQSDNEGPTELQEEVIRVMNKAV